MSASGTLVLALALLGATSQAAGATSSGFVPDELLVKFKPVISVSERAALEHDLHAQLVRPFAFIGVDHLKLAGGGDLETALARLALDPRVEYAERNSEIHAETIPNDPRFPELWGLRNTGQTGGVVGADIHAAAAWDIATDAAAVKIGLIDSGVDGSHPDLAANLWTNAVEAAGLPGVDDDGNGYVDDIHGWDVVNGDGDPFDDNGHGTHCAGAIAACGDNGIGVVGAAWRAQIVAIKFLDALGGGSTANAIAALEYAIVAGVKLTSNSWGGGGFSQALLDAIDAAGAAGELFVATAGRSSLNLDLFPTYPASYDSPHVLAVTASDASDNLASFANYGPVSVDLAAPGVDILSTLPGGGYGLASGTSPSTAYAAGVCALVAARFPTLGPLEIRECVIRSAEVTPGLTGRVRSNGRLDAYRAVHDGPLAVGPVTSGLALERPRPNPSSGECVLGLETPRAGVVNARIYSTAGRLIAVLETGHVDAGRHSLAWNGRDLGGRPVPPGVYFARVEFEGRRLGHAIVRLR